MKVKAVKYWFGLLFFFLLHSSADGQNKTSIFEKLTADENPTLIITTDLIQIMENRTNEEYHRATLKTPDKRIRNLKIRVRGKFRRRICEMPPLKLKFSKKDLKKEGLSEMDEIKMVTSCRDSKEADEWIQREYVAYKLFNEVSPVSFRSGMVEVIFRDAHVESFEVKMQCMLLEHVEELANRFNSVEVKAFGLPPDSLHIRQAAAVSMFNYMIGNTDWEVAGARNVKFLKSKGDPKAKIVVVPYDFDFAGLVNTDYAVPESQTGLSNVRERFLMADGIPYKNLKQAAVSMTELLPKFEKVIKQKHINRSAQAYMRAYIRSFFKEVALKNAESLMSPPPMD